MTTKWILSVGALFGALILGIGIYMLLHPKQDETPAQISQPAQQNNDISNYKTINFPANRGGWYPVGSGDFVVKVTGNIDFGGISSTPKGVVRTGEGVKLALTPEFPFGAVVGKIGADGKPFFVGSDYSFNAGNKHVYLAINDSIYSDNTGNYIVEIKQINESRSVQQNSKPISKTLNIPFQNFTNAKWDGYNPGYDGASFEQATHLWMSARGKITYIASIPEQPSGAEIKVTLSSELNKTTSNNRSDSSDVILIVNGKSQQTINVIPDDLQGKQYTWSIPTGVLHTGNNELIFSVGSGQYSNGLTIYSPITVRY